eukprot:TRINITY_DN5312_c0_g1_i2.p1 TRINITY_DN5312_c0_g1~~TRINITY_DN5312_c0_g1_i2.p1  ORF type:complete len:421 (+),score=136.33 TRINITY_DN5312_c0_g1_i2:92-1264(+)
MKDLTNDELLKLATRIMGLTRKKFIEGEDVEIEPIKEEKESQEKEKKEVEVKETKKEKKETRKKKQTKKEKQTKAESEEVFKKDGTDPLSIFATNVTNHLLVWDKPKLAQLFFEKDVAFSDMDKDDRFGLYESLHWAAYRENVESPHSSNRMKKEKIPYCVVELFRKTQVIQKPFNKWSLSDLHSLKRIIQGIGMTSLMRLQHLDDSPVMRSTDSDKSPRKRKRRTKNASPSSSQSQSQESSSSEFEASEQSEDEEDNEYSEEVWSQEESEEKQDKRNNKKKKVESESEAEISEESSEEEEENIEEQREITQLNQEIKSSGQTIKEMSKVGQRIDSFLARLEEQKRQVMMGIIEIKLLQKQMKEEMSSAPNTPVKGKRRHNQGSSSPHVL